MIARLRRLIAGLLIVSIAGIGVPLPAHAGIVPTGAALASAERDRIASMLERADGRAQLEAYGVGAADVKGRVAALTDEEAVRLAGKLDSLPAGGDGIIGALVLIFVVLLITDILGLTKVFPFTRPIK